MRVRTVRPRGIRNNNPLNIRRSAAQWRGLAPRQNDPSFCVFVDMGHGLRAAFLLLHTYTTRYGLTTLRQVIARWAPPPENDTATYLLFVSRQTGCAPDRPLPPMMPHEAFWPRLVEAMAQEECGKDVFDRGLLQRGQVEKVYERLVAARECS